MKYIYCCMFVVAVCANAPAAPPAAAPPTAHAQLPPPILQYNQRYVMHQFDDQSIAILDTAEGKIWTALLAQYGFKTWRSYDLNAIAKERKMPDAAPPAALAHRPIHARYNVRGFSGFVSFFDTLTGRVWTCRYSKGVLDMWKCHDVASGAQNNDE